MALCTLLIIFCQQQISIAKRGRFPKSEFRNNEIKIADNKNEIRTI